MGCTGVYIVFLFLLLNIDRGYSLEPPLFRAKIKNNTFFHLKIIVFIAVKNCSILHGRVFVMHGAHTMLENAMLRLFPSKTQISLCRRSISIGISLYLRTDGVRFYSHLCHPAGDVLCILVEPEKGVP